MASEMLLQEMRALARLPAISEHWRKSAEHLLIRSEIPPGGQTAVVARRRSQTMRGGRLSRQFLEAIWSFHLRAPIVLMNLSGSMLETMRPFLIWLLRL